MKKIILTYGLIAGLISSSLFIGLMLLGKGAEHDFKHGMIYGYTLMILAFAFIFVATKMIRDKQLGGTISFGRAFLIGLYISLIASTVYVLVWFVDFYFFNPDFVQQYSAQMASVGEMYKNPLFVALLTYAEILPVGILVTLISAWVLRKKNKEGLMNTAVPAH